MSKKIDKIDIDSLSVDCIDIAFYYNYLDNIAINF